MNLTPLARTLRKRSTDAERLLWRYLRDRRLGGYKFRRQVAIEPYIVDFACLEAKLIVELDGGQHVERQHQDKHRTQQLAAMGYTVLRFWNHEVMAETEAVVGQIYEALCAFPHPILSSEEDGD